MHGAKHRDRDEAEGVIRIVGKLVAASEALEREVETLLREVRNA